MLSNDQSFLWQTSKHIPPPSVCPSETLWGAHDRRRNPKGSHNLSLVDTTELSTPVVPAALEDLPTSVYMFVVDLIGHITLITVSSLAMYVGALVPGTKMFNFSSSHY